MNHIENNAKVIFLENSSCLSVSSDKNKVQLPYDQSYICDDGLLDSRYFSELFYECLKFISPNSKRWNVLFILSFKEFLSTSFVQNVLSQHQMEREAIYYFQYQKNIPVLEYDYFCDFKNQKAVAVKKILLQNIRECFALIPLRISLQFVPPWEFEGYIYE